MAILNRAPPKRIKDMSDEILYQRIYELNNKLSESNKQNTALQGKLVFSEAMYAIACEENDELKRKLKISSGEFLKLTCYALALNAVGVALVSFLIWIK